MRPGIYLVILGSLALAASSGAGRASSPDAGPLHRQSGLLQGFAYGDVTLTGGPLGSQAEGARAYYLGISDDDLLHGFRVRAKLPAPGKDMGGWYDPEDFAGAHPFGQYLSALARWYANTGDSRFKDKVFHLVHGFHETMAPDGFFYSSLKACRDWGCYIYDKNAIGMRDAYTLTGNAEALIVLSRMTDWAAAHLPRRNDEWYTLPENLYECYQLTHEERYLALAREYDYSRDYYDAFARGQNAFLPTRHAYSHVNTLSSAARAYEVTGEEKYFQAIAHAWDFLTTTQMYASGGWGPNERFVPPGQGALAGSLSYTGASFETPCGSYANVKLDRYLLHYTGQPRYGDNMERVLLNGMLSALPMQPGGRTFYYADYRPGATKVYFPTAWPCCSGTYAQITADYPLDTYFHDESSLVVNLFTPSRLTWRRPQGEVSLEQLTDYPATDTTTLVVHSKIPTAFTLRIRRPGWLQKGAQMWLNGRQVHARSLPGAFLSLERAWHDGDRVVVRFPMTLRFEPVAPETPRCAALLYGPALLTALASGPVQFHGDIHHPERWIRPVKGKPLEFSSIDGTLRFVPLYRVTDERYTTYGWF